MQITPLQHARVTFRCVKPMFAAAPAPETPPPYPGKTISRLRNLADYVMGGLFVMAILFCGFGSVDASYGRETPNPKTPDDPKKELE